MKYLRWTLWINSISLTYDHILFSILLPFGYIFMAFMFIFMSFVNFCLNLCEGRLSFTARDEHWQSWQPIRRS